MEGNAPCSRCGTDTGVRYHTTTSRLVRLEKKRRRRLMAPLPAVVLLLLASAAAGLLLVFGGRRRCPLAADGQLVKQPDSNSPGNDLRLQQTTHLENPSAMLTAPVDSNVHGECLQWESEQGNAHCHGGFNYSNGNLVVPVSGIYRVFLQITYVSRDSCSGDLRLTNNVFFVTDLYRGSLHLLSSVDTVSCSMEHWSKSIYMAGLFNLVADGRLYVTSSNPELISEREELVFFGAERLAR